VGVSWTSWCAGGGFRLEPPYIDVQLGEGRHHRVMVEEHVEEFLLTAIVARQAVVANTPGAALQAWLRNRSTALVGFRIDLRGRLEGKSWIPKAGLTAQEFQLYARTLAAECDRFEYALTGRDVE
jgi:hypothetical protein